MQIVTEPIQKINTLPHQEQSSFDDQQAEDLFNQIEIGQNLNKNQDHQQQLKNPFDQLEQKPKTPTKIKKKKMMELDSDNFQQQNNSNHQEPNEQRGKSLKKDKKQRKLDKKLRKKLKKQRKLKKKKNQSKLRKMNQQKEGGEQNKKPQLSQEWSGQSQNQQQESNLSSDSLLQRLNPSKKKNKSNKKESAQKKQGFLLKQLGNDAEVNYQNGQELPNDDSSFDSNNKKKKNRVKDKVQKKQTSKNQQILKSLLEIGLCMGQQSDEQNKNQGQIDNGLEQVYNMKNTKKKGPKIANKFFSDMQIKLDDEDEKNQPLPKQIQLQIKPRIRQGGPSLISSSFLSKVEKIRKVRGMESEMLHQQYQKMISLKAKQSMVKLINQKSLQQAEEIDLQVKVPQVIKGKGELNNSMFLKRISSGSMYDSKQSLQGPEEIYKKESESKMKYNSKAKLTRFDFFRSMSQELKARKSRDISEDFIKNSFKVTQLEEIQEMRKKNEQKRRKQALKGSDDESEQQQEEKKEQMVGNNLGFMNFRVEVQKQQMDEQKQILSEDKDEDLNNKQDKEKQSNENNVQGIKKTQSFCIEFKKDPLPDEQYKRLLLLEEGVQPEQQNDSEEENENENEELNQILNGPNHAQEQIEIQNQEDIEQHNEEEQENIDEQQLNSAEKIDLEVELDVVSSQNNLQNQQELEEQEANQSIENRQQPINEQYQQYLNQLQAEGIKINKRHQNRRKQGRNQQDLQVDQKQNDNLLQNKKKSVTIQAEGQELNQARRQFKKLRKLATIIKQKKQIQMKTQRARQFYDQQAEEGSDNEEHDHEVKKINDDDEAEEYEGIDLDADLEQMIDNAVDINEEDQQLAFRKYMEDVKIQDRQQIKRIMKGDFKRRRDHEPMMDEMDEDQKKRVQRMEEFEEYIKKKEMQQGQDLYMNENKSDKQDQEDSEFDDDDEDKNERAKAEIEKKKNPLPTLDQQYQQVDQMNQQNLQRYLDDAIVDNWRSVVKVKRQSIQIPQSCHRQKKTQMRNTMKPKGIESGVPSKLKKTSSHLNEMIMKNKEKIKPIIFTKNFSVLNRR